MDIQHISALIQMLASLGFSPAVSRILLFNACLRQKQFIIKEQLQFGEDAMHYQLYFKEDTASKKLACPYYEATLRKAVGIAPSVINGIDTSDLEKRMRSVDWQMPLELSTSDNLQLSDKTTWEREAIMEAITGELEALSSTAEGAGIANMLKYKFWTDPALQSAITDLQAITSKYELSQRFYVIAGNGITASEAYRFLNNRWMERTINAANRLLRLQESTQPEQMAVVKGAGERKKSRQSREKTGK